MKLTVRDFDDTKKFTELYPGDVFAYKGKYFIMLDYDAMYEVCEREINAFCLTDNSMASFDDNAEVIRVPAEVIITRVNNSLEEQSTTGTYFPLGADFPWVREDD